jgi:hypothetical protein
MSGLKLIVENDFRDYEVIVEQANPNVEAQIVVEGPYIVSNDKNANGRIYKESMMVPVVEKFNTEMVEAKRAFGELEHPDTIEIDLNNACHFMTSLVKDGNIWIGKSKILNTTPNRKYLGTPKGDILAAVIMAGGKIGMSTRGVGYMNDEYVDDYELVTVDAVANPSGPGCFVNGICESKSFIIDTHGQIMERAIDSFENGLKDMPNTFCRKTKDKYLDSLFRDLINKI